MWISLTPASLKRVTICLLVVPRTMESSIKTTRFPLMADIMGLSFIRTRSTRSFSPGEIKVLPIYLFFTSPIPYGIPEAWEKPRAASRPLSGTPITRSALAGFFCASIFPACILAAETETLSITIPCSLNTKISPGSKSRTNFAPTAVRAQLSEAIT